MSPAEYRDIEPGSDLDRLADSTFPPAAKRKMLWTLFYPGLTSKIIVDTALELGLVQILPNGKLSRGQIGLLSYDDWINLRNGCANKLGIDDCEEYERSLVRATDVYKQHEIALKKHMRDHGIREM